jgi:rubrerythrin
MAAADYAWGNLESPEAIPFGEMHYLIQPHQALTLALAAEERALAFYTDVVNQAPTDDLRNLAEEFVLEEAEHVALVREWLQRYPEPEHDWDTDDDPPVQP